MNSARCDQRPLRLTVAALVRNDAQGLARTLESVEAIADEIVVVDTGSSDNSRQVARQLGARLLDYEWCDDFAAARNYALANATGDWMLLLDCGETLTAPDAAALRQSIHERGDVPRAYLLVIQLPAAAGTIAAEQIARVRLIPRTAGLRFQGRVRESLHESIEAAGIEVDGLPWRIQRGAAENDPARKHQKAQRNLRLAELEIDEVGRLPQLVNCLAEAAQTLGEKETAIGLYRETLQSDRSATGDRLEAYYGLLTCLDGVPDARNVQLSLCVEALEQFPLDAQLLCALAGYLQAEGRIDVAVRAYETAFRYGRVNPLVWHVDEIIAIAATCYSAALQLQGDDEKALAVLQEALQCDSGSPRLHRAALELRIKLGHHQEAAGHIEQLGLDAQATALLRQTVQGACLARSDLPAALSHLQAAYGAGCQDTICLRWLALVHMALGQSANARHVVDQWRKLDPANAPTMELLDSGIQVARSTPGDADNGGNRFRLDAAALGKASPRGQATATSLSE